MNSFPTLRSWMNSLIFIFSTSLMLIIVRFLLNIADFFTYALKIENEIIMLTFCISLFLITPILTYGYIHYIIFGKPEHPQIPWLISGDSAIEGIWMLINFILCLIFTILILIGLDSPLLIGLDRLTQANLEEAATQAKNHIIWLGAFWFIATAYLYHLRSILSNFVLKIIRSIASHRNH